MARTPTQWSFDYEDLQKLTGLSGEAVRQAKSREEFNPDDLGSVILWIGRHGNMDLRRDLMEAMLMRQYPKTKGGAESSRKASGKGSSKRLVPSPIEDAPKKKSAKKAPARS